MKRPEILTPSFEKNEVAIAPHACLKPEELKEGMQVHIAGQEKIYILEDIDTSNTYYLRAVPGGEVVRGKLEIQPLTKVTEYSPSNPSAGE